MRSRGIPVPGLRLKSRQFILTQVMNFWPKQWFITWVNPSSEYSLLGSDSLFGSEQLHCPVWCMEPDDNDSKYNLETLCIVQHLSRCCILDKRWVPRLKYFYEKGLETRQNQRTSVLSWIITWEYVRARAIWRVGLRAGLHRSQFRWHVIHRDSTCDFVCQLSLTISLRLLQHILCYITPIIG